MMKDLKKKMPFFVVVFLANQKIVSAWEKYVSLGIL